VVDDAHDHEIRDRLIQPGTDAGLVLCQILPADIVRDEKLLPHATTIEWQRAVEPLERTAPGRPTPPTGAARPARGSSTGANRKHGDCYLIGDSDDRFQ